ncbi:MAG: crossover junction endodeoxyribonuclease RuvC [Candidatus Vogelbacteria bacterium CG22_combo_CG10-13_8_21_14_all_37_9]|uniref:Crossover junction endodeoxyribonuclease RuvC n=1 Tax=Candidatus Vogelbacteria bacterium CG22_combo_CG10-13_8_21_14_all_37_9 TaxID=1975046 RepID=A0A2H0BKA2_9BACT|nr:MAG: crossover junction endodeoxyribonuclease RuvC [bacterium CG10_37_50]PIP58061.1 MAG: crossover junction endodeoxyribonuclease RuvC [Candidatus Vogelbacteria bacterium CG22_combo_CG10-13_8_21_14_all_37_9]
MLKTSSPTTKIRIIGIDPGYERLGVAIVDKTKTGEVLIFSTCLRTKTKDSFTQRLLDLGQALEKIIKTYRPEALALESLFININQKTAMKVAETRGMIIYLAGKNQLPVFDFTPLEIKSCLTGYGQADKKQVINLVCQLLKLAPSKALDDEYDAIATALTLLARWNEKVRLLESI